MFLICVISAQRPGTGLYDRLCYHDVTPSLNHCMIGGPERRLSAVLRHPPYDDDGALGLLPNNSHAIQTSTAEMGQARRFR
jgi:hypothetical protein